MINKSGIFTFALLALMGLATAAQAQPVPGCDPKVLDAMQKKAQAKVAVDVNNTESIIDKPDSVLAMTCFNKSAGTTALLGGQIFSGNFTDGLKPIIEDALQAMYDDFQDGAGFEALSVNYLGGITLANDQSCDDVKNLWNTVKDKGVQMGLPMVTLDKLVNGTAGNMPTGVLDEYVDNWKQEVTDGVFSDLKDALARINAPTIPSFGANQSSCQVLVAAGIPVPCP